MSSITVLAQKFRPVWSLLDERTRRIMAANEAIGLGYGGVSLVHRACGLARKAITKGIGEIEAGDFPGAGRIRRPGAGRKNLTLSDPALLGALDDLIDGGTRGDPESPLRWICKSTRTLAAELTRQDHPISITMLTGIERFLRGFGAAAGAVAEPSHQPRLDRVERPFPRQARSFF